MIEWDSISWDLDRTRGTHGMDYDYVRVMGCELTIRRYTGGHWNIHDMAQGTFANRPIVAGPFETVEAAKAAYLVMMSDGEI